MRARAVVGKRIIAIDQERVVGNGGGGDWALDRIYLDDGTVLSLSVIELEGGADYAVVGTPFKKKREDESEDSAPR